jgi:hypothetical protein
MYYQQQQQHDLFKIKKNKFQLIAKSSSKKFLLKL